MKRKIIFILAVLLLVFNGCGSQKAQTNRDVELVASKIEGTPYLGKKYVPVSTENLVMVCPWFDRMDVVDDWLIEYYKGSFFLNYNYEKKEWTRLFDVETNYNAYVDEVLYNHADRSFFLNCSIMPEGPESLPEEYLIQKVSSKGLLEWEIPLGKQGSVKMFLDEDNQNLIVFGHSEEKEEVICIDCEKGAVERKDLQKAPSKSSDGTSKNFFCCTSTEKGTSVYCLDQNGDLVWKNDLDLPDYQYAVSHNKDLFLVAPYSLDMLQLDAETGTLVQKISLPKAGHLNINGPPIVIGDRIYLAATGGLGKSQKTAIIQYHTTTAGQAKVIETIDGYYWYSSCTHEGSGIMYLESMEHDDILIYTISVKNK